LSARVRSPTIGEQNDRELVTAAQAGDRRALDTLLRRHYDRINAVCRRLAGADRDADDATQEAMISIVKGLPRFDGRSSFGTWAYRIATNAALDELRRRRRRPSLHAVSDDAGQPDPADPAAHRRIDAVADRLAIDGALADLADDFRTAVVLRDVADLDYAEIADALDVPVGTVKSRIARGRRHLAAALGNPPDGPKRPTTQSTQHTDGAPESTSSDDQPRHDAP